MAMCDYGRGLLYSGFAAHLGLAARVCHSWDWGFSTSRTGWALLRMTTRSPVISLVPSWPSQKMVVPSLTRMAVTSSVEFNETTTGRNERLCGQRGVTQRASTLGLMM